MKAVKVTEIVGNHDLGFEWDVIQPASGGTSLNLSDMIPAEALESRGRWRITVEFEPEEE